MKTSASVLGLIVAATSVAQWSARPLNETGVILGVAPDIQVGADSQTNRAKYWQNTPESITDLHPAGYANSIAYAAAGGFQGGTADLNGWDHAGLWQGSAGSWIDLHPSNATSSELAAMHGDWAVGRVLFDKDYHAYAWQGISKEIDLHPAGASYSAANATYGGRHGGGFVLDDVGMACIFDTNPKSITILHPSSAVSSTVLAMHGSVQVGLVVLDTPTRAALWRGTAESWVDLYPGELHVASIARGVSDGIQVGRYGNEAAMWSGSAGSYESLDAFLPTEMLSSEAFAVVRDVDRVTVAGRAFWAAPIGTSPMKPYIWVSRYESPEAFSIFRGLAVTGGLPEITESDDSRMIVRPGPVFTTGEAPVQVVVEGTSLVEEPSSLGFSCESAVSFSLGTRIIQLFNFRTGSFEMVDTRSTTSGDSVVNVSIRVEPERFVEAGTRKMRARMTFRPNAPVLSYPWQARLDLARFRLPG